MTSLEIIAIQSRHLAQLAASLRDDIREHTTALPHLTQLCAFLDTIEALANIAKGRIEQAARWDAEAKGAVGWTPPPMPKAHRFDSRDSCIECGTLAYEPRGKLNCGTPVNNLTSADRQQAEQAAERA